MKNFQFFLIILQLILIKTQNNPIFNVTLVESPVQSVIWCGSDRVVMDDDETIILEDVETKLTNILFILTEKGMVYASNTYGEKWANFTNLLENQFQSKMNSSAKIIIKNMYASPSNSKNIFLIGSDGYSFITDSCGKNNSMFEHDSLFENFKINRMNDKYLLAQKASPCNMFDDECDPDEKKLFLSQNRGQTWEKILDNVVEVHWDKLVHFSIVPDYRIIALHRIYQKGQNNDLKILTLSDDFYKTRTQIEDKVLQFYQSNMYLFILTIDEDNTESFILKIAPSFSQNFKPQEIDLPFKRNKDHSFTVLDASHGEIYIAINHEGDSSKMTNVYVSDYRGYEFSLSLMQNVRNQEGNCDFETISSNEGTFIANIYDADEIQRQMFQANDNKMVKKEKGILNQPKNIMDNYQKTIISFNKGSKWHKLKAPATNLKGQPITCSGECSLHLNGRTKKNGNPLYSSENAPGMILGTGNVGLYLENNPLDQNTYLSRDGGHNWIEIKQHSHLYEIGDHGGLIVLGKENQEVNQIHYSWDEGNTWVQQKITDKTFEIINIVTEPSNMEQRFLIFGKRKSDKKNKMVGVIVSFDLSKIHQRVCSGHWQPGTGDSDYEYWTPINYSEDQCVMGARVRYIRRKRDVQCFNPREFDSVSDVQSCACTEEDWECIYGFYNDKETGKCVPMSTRFQNQLTAQSNPPADCYGTYEIPSGYRKVSGSYCDGGVDLGPQRVECPAKPKVDEPKSTEYVPLDQEKSQLNLDDLYKLPRKKKGDSSSSFTQNTLLVVATILVLAILYYHRDKFLSFFQSSPQSSIRGGRRFQPINLNQNQNKQHGEEKGLFSNEDDEEQL